MKRILLIIFFTQFLYHNSIAVPDSVGVEIIAGERFILHKVMAGEGWYGIARAYGITYAELRMANRAEGDQLKIGQIVRIPEKAKVNDPRFQKNYTDKVQDIPKEKAPVIETRSSDLQEKKHKVEAGQTLFSISRMYNVSVDQLKKWNRLENNTISKGQELIVGSEVRNRVEETQVSPIPEKKVEEIEKPQEIPVKIPETVEQAKEVPVVKDESTVVVKTATPGKSTAEEKKNEKKYSFANGRQEVQESGNAGWIDDGEINPNKYYALHRTAPSGTIIKVTNTANNSSVFVKVVGVLQETSDSEDLIIKISKASAERLKAVEQKFHADLVYGLSGN